ncbi:MAG: hypothetical protein WCA48_26010, partial [Pseudomonas gingeri]
PQVPERDGIVILDENFMQVDTEPEGDEDEEQQLSEAEAEEKEFEAVAVAHRTQSEINADNRAFLVEYITRNGITLATRWNDARTIQLEAAQGCSKRINKLVSVSARIMEEYP